MRDLSNHPEAVRSRERRAELSRLYLGPTIPHARRTCEIENGCVLIGSDAHYWPGDASTAHRAFVAAIRELQPVAVIMNGDVIDGARVSRWAPGHWDDLASQPALVDELATAQTRLREIRAACAPDTLLFWPMGNHDARFEKYLIQAAPEAVGIHGTRLKDHFPDWLPCWDVLVNEHDPAPLLVKHRFKGGEYAPRNNTLKAGVSVVTGHLHSLAVYPFSDLRGTRWGVDCGTLAVPHGPQFVNYTEDNPVNWRSGFTVLTFAEGRLLWPELVHVIDEAAGLICFRGEVWEV